MILVTLGTQDKPFVRLLDEVQKQIDSGTIKDRVVVQAGNTPYNSDKMEIFDLIPGDKYDEFMGDCDILITHGGVGSIITGLKLGKKIIAVPRLSKYGEHTNDHQIQIVNKFYDMGYILKCDDNDNFKKVLKDIKKFEPKKFESNNERFIKIIEDFIEGKK